MGNPNRPRYPEAEARAFLTEDCGPAITHLVRNPEGDFSIMQHIVCEHCDWCDEQGDCRGRGDAIPVDYKEDPYERTGR